MAKMRPLKNPEKPVPVLSDDHVRLLLADCSGKDFRNRRDCAIIRLFLDTGMRLEGLSGLMEARTSINLTASLHSTAADLSEVASNLAHLSTDEGIEQQARVLDRIAEDATEGAAILRAQIARRKRVLGTPPHSDTPRRHL